MLEYLIDLLGNIDRCDITTNELRKHIAQNNDIIRGLNRIQFGGGKGDGKKDDESGAADPALLEGLDIGMDTDELVIAIGDRLKASEKATSDVREKMEAFEQNEGRRNETIEIAGMTADFLGELGKMVGSKDTEYLDLQAQIDEIGSILEGYVDRPKTVAEAGPYESAETHIADEPTGTMSDS